MKKAGCMILCVLLLLSGCGLQNGADNLPADESCKAVLPFDHFFYEGLDETGKACYRAMYAALQSGEERRMIPGVSSGMAQAAYNALLSDHPEIYWARDYWYGESGGDFVFQPEYLFTVPERNAADRQMANALQELEQGLDGLDDYEKALALFVRTVQWIEYDETAQNGQTLYGALIERRAVCAGYARLYQYLLCRQSIPAVYIEGTMNSGTRHAWVEARLDGEWAYFDPTSAEPGELQPGCTALACQYAFFGMTYADLTALGYQADKDLVLPVAASLTNTYYSRTGNLLSGYTRAAVEERINEAIERGEGVVSLRFLEEAAARAAVDDLFGSQQGILMILAQLKERVPSLISSKAYYTFYPELGCVDLYLLRET